MDEEEIDPELPLILEAALRKPRNSNSSTMGLRRSEFDTLKHRCDISLHCVIETILGLNEHAMQEGVCSIADRVNFYRVVGVHAPFREPGKASEVARRYDLQVQGDGSYHGLINLEQKIGTGSYLEIDFTPKPPDQKSTLIINGAPSVKVIDAIIDILMVMGYDPKFRNQESNKGLGSGKEVSAFGSRIYDIYNQHFGILR